MSNTAIVAIPTDNNEPTYDIYSSRNGGRNFKLYKFLEDYDESTLETLQALPHRLPDEFDNLEKAASEIGFGGEVEHPKPDQPIVQPNPMKKGVTVEEIINRSDYITNDVLYVVKPDTVTTYYLSYFTPNIPSIFAINTAVYVYPRNNNPQSTISESENPFYKLEGDDFVRPHEASKLRVDAPHIKTVEAEFAQAHMGLLRNIYGSRNNEKVGGCGTITDNFKFIAKFKQPVDTRILELSRGGGIAIKCALKYGTPKHIWNDIHHRADEIRWNHTKEAFNYLSQAENEKEAFPKINRVTKDFIEKNKSEFGSARPSKTISLDN
jgi:hypothetical protein